jgi:hypothetical protein
MEYPKRLKRIARIDLTLWLHWTRHKIWLIDKQINSVDEDVSWMEFVMNSYSKKVRQKQHGDL